MGRGWGCGKKALAGAVINAHHQARSPAHCVVSVTLLPRAVFICGGHSKDRPLCADSRPRTPKEGKLASCYNWGGGVYAIKDTGKVVQTAEGKSLSTTEGKEGRPWSKRPGLHGAMWTQPGLGILIRVTLKPFLRSKLRRSRGGLSGLGKGVVDGIRGASRKF